MEAMLIHPSGLVNLVEFPEAERLPWYYEQLDCDCVDVVSPYGIETIAEEHELEAFVGRFCLICDDEALLKESPHVNPIASLLYGVMDHGQPLCGKVLVAKNLETDDGIETVGMTKQDVMLVRAAINSLIEMHNAGGAGNG